MADTSKYKSVSLRHDTYEKLKYISKNLVDIELSLAHTISHITELTYANLTSPNYVAPLKGDTAYQKWKKKIFKNMKFLPIGDAESNQRR